MKRILLALVLVGLAVTSASAQRKSSFWTGGCATVTNDTGFVVRLLVGDDHYIKIEPFSTGQVCP